MRPLGPGLDHRRPKQNLSVFSYPDNLSSHLLIFDSIAIFIGVNLPIIASTNDPALIQKEATTYVAQWDYFEFKTIGDKLHIKRIIPISSVGKSLGD